MGFVGRLQSINGLAALVELDIKVEVFNPVLFVFLNRTRSQSVDGFAEVDGLWVEIDLLHFGVGTHHDGAPQGKTGSPASGNG